jgi:hypothetical protein
MYRVAFDSKCHCSADLCLDLTTILFSLQQIQCVIVVLQLCSVEFAKSVAML